MMNNFLRSFKIFMLVALLMSTLFACRKTYPYFFPDGTPGHGADSSTITVDTSQSNIDYSKYPQARIFPGLVGANVPRIEDTAITLDLDYHYIGRTLRISVPPQPQFSVGLYAPPGELITIEVPEGLHNLSVQIGGWTDNLGGKLNPKRDPLIYSRQKLGPGKNYVRNLYGGTVYILSPRPVEKPVTLHFSGVVKENDFVLSEANSDPNYAEKWWARLQKYDVPWLELRSPNFTALVPRAKFLIEGLKDPTKALQFWENAVREDYYEWMGLSRDPGTAPIDQAPMLPFRAVLDIDISVGYGHSGYPVMFVDDMYWFNSVANYESIKRVDAWGSFHEFGHNCQQTRVWSLSNLGETTNNLFIFHAIMRMNKIFKQEGIDTIGFGSKANMNPEIAARALAYSEKDGPKQFVNDISDAFIAIIPFLQIFRDVKPYAGSQWNSGWDFMTVLYRKARRAKRLSANDQDKRDFIYEALCEFTHKDMIPWFNHWGMRISDVSRTIIQEKNYPVLSRNLWAYDPTLDTGGHRPFVYDPYTPSKWSVISVSSFQDGNEGSNVLDGDNSTYWSAEPDDPADTPPQSISINMGSSLNVGSFFFVQRQNVSSGRIKNIKIETSNDNISWTLLGTYSLDDINQEQEIQLSTPKTFKYFRLTIENSSDLWETDIAALADVWVEAP